MPRYDFRCSKCGHKFTATAGIEERKNVTCPECGAKEVQQLITGCSFNTGGCSDSPAAGGG